jgi:DNA-binding XRE family transcriptional regulator
MQRGDKPYKDLGLELANVRTRVKESVSEVSGAVEISDEQLIAFENGDICPSEDVLHLIITHFNLRDEESDKLWDLAGYDEDEPEAHEHEAVFSHQPAIILMPIDARVVYSDSFQVSINQHGVVMNFLQGVAPGGQQMSIARVGMSLEHAKRISETLQQTIKTASENKHQRNLPNANGNK